MATMKALVMQGDKKASVVSDRPLPKARPKYVGVKVNCVALNPTDWKHVDFFNGPGLLIGCDYSGVVEDPGEGYDKPWKRGDRICGMTHGGDKLQQENGAFAEHIMAVADAQFKVPPNMSDEDASTLGVGLLTCGQGLYQAMGLHMPGHHSPPGDTILIYGGSTATGTLGIQCAKLSGYKVITTCSPRNFDLVKSLGAVEAFDYNDPECAQKIKTYTDGKLMLVWDTISLEGSAKICADCMASGAKYGVLLPIKDPPRKDVHITHTLAYTAMGDAMEMREKIPAKPEDYLFARKWADVCDEMLLQGLIKPHPPKVMQGGLEGVLEGLDLLRKEQVSGEKLVYRIS